MPVAAPQDTADPLARTAADIALLSSFLAGPDPEDPARWGWGKRCRFFVVLR